VSGRYVARRVAVAIATLFAIIVFNFFLFRTLGDPAKDLIRGRLKPDVRAAIIHERGYDQSQFTQFRRYIDELAHGDLGDSTQSEKPVTDELKTAIPNTLLLLGLATVLSMWIGTRLGILAAWRRGKPRDTWIGQVSLAFYSMPDFWLGMLFIGFFAGTLAWLPGGLKATPGGGGGWDHIQDVATHLILPTVTLALGEIGQYVFISRAAVADVMDADHVLTARAIGLQPLAVRRRHIVPSARLPIVTQIALNLGFVLGGAITVEALFSWPGIGLATLTAIQAKDYPMLQGLYLVTSVLVIVCNLAADLLYARLDPRVRTE
jgi:ABC-type dipeptide/oligopeptide/nickel transport system permease component